MMDLMTSSTLLMTMMLLMFPMLSRLGKKITVLVKSAFFMSLLPMTLVMKTNTQSINIRLPVFNMETMNMTIMINKYSILFMPIALLITWSIMQFSEWYMTKEPTNKFQKLLLMFLMSMLTLTSSGNLMQLMVGWEGVGILSFMLINWWSGRANANAASLQAIIYNRIADMGLILVLVTALSEFGTWDTQSLLSMSTKNTMIAMGLTLAAMGKSAQFFMHLWLPAAMEGPTPVSSLLHSSTMVVAGVYLLAQMHPMMDDQIATTTCLFLGTTTTLYSATCATSQNDIKKIIAFSTSSQLGLMMVAIGINKPDLAIFHMITHATFKSTLFLCSGSMIHNTMNEQDIRKTNCSKNTLPITTTLMIINGLALTGLPFLSGFYSKDAIMETILSMNNNTWATTSTMIATTMTSFYTMRMIIYMMKSFFNGTPTIFHNESNYKQTTPMMRLTTIATVLGSALALTTMLATETISTPMKLLPLMTIVTGAYLSTQLTPKPTMNRSLKFTNQLAFFPLYHRTIPLTTLTTGYKVTTQLTDLVWLEKTAPMVIDKSSQLLTSIISTQMGQMKNYFIMFTLTLTLSLIYLL